MVQYLAVISPVQRITDDKIEIPYTVKIRGVAVDKSVNKNGWSVSDEFLSEIAKTLKNKSIRVNHGRTVTDIIGRVTSSNIDGDKVIFEAEILGSDPLSNAVKEKIMNGLIDSVSIGLDGEKIVCSVCGKQTRDGEKIIHNPAEHGGHEIVYSGSVKELSIVAEPAYQNTKIQIAASFEEAIDELLKVTQPIRAEVTDVAEPPTRGRPAEEEKEEKGDKMAEVPKTGEPEARAPSFDDVLGVLKKLSYSADEIAKKMADIDARLKSLEDAEEARRRAEEARRKSEEEARRKSEEEARRKSEEEVKEDEEDEDRKDKAEVDASLEKSQTRLVASREGPIPEWAKQIAQSMGLRW